MNIILSIIINLFLFISPIISQNLQDASNKSFFIPLKQAKFSSKMSSYTELYLGSSFKKQLFLLDTDSSISSVACKNYCIRCGQHEHSFYSKENISPIQCHSNVCSQMKGKCNEEQQCEFSSDDLKGFYYDETLNGVFGITEDYKNVLKIPFGCTTVENDLHFADKANGVIGLKNTDDNFINLLYSKKYINKKMFSICKSSNYAGYFSFGQVPQKEIISKKLRYFNMNKKIKGKYAFEMNKIYFMFQEFKVDVNKIITEINPNSIYSYFPKKYYDEFMILMDGYCKKYECGVKEIINNEIDNEYYYENGFSVCYTYKDEEEKQRIIKKMPSINFNLPNKKTFKWEALNYMYTSKENNKLSSCLGFKISSDDSNIILGSNFIQDNNFIFDLDKQQIAFMKSNCSIDSLKQCGLIDEIKVDIKKKMVYPLQLLTIVFFIAFVVLLCIVLCIKNGESFQKPKIIEEKQNNKFKKVKILKDTPVPSMSSPQMDV